MTKKNKNIIQYIQHVLSNFQTEYDSSDTYRNNIANYNTCILQF
jgi:hypothetical protein